MIITVGGSEENIISRCRNLGKSKDMRSTVRVQLRGPWFTQISGD